MSMSRKQLLYASLAAISVGLYAIFRPARRIQAPAQVLDFGDGLYGSGSMYASPEAVEQIQQASAPRTIPEDKPQKYSTQEFRRATIEGLRQVTAAASAPHTDYWQHQLLGDLSQRVSDVRIAVDDLRHELQSSRLIPDAEPNPEPVFNYPRSEAEEPGTEQEPVQQSSW